MSCSLLRHDGAAAEIGELRQAVFVLPDFGSCIRMGIAKILARILKRFGPNVFARRANHDNRCRCAVDVGLHDEIRTVEGKFAYLTRAQRVRRG